MSEAEGEMGDDKSEIDCFPPSILAAKTHQKEWREARILEASTLFSLSSSLLISYFYFAFNGHCTVMPLIANGGLLTVRQESGQ